MTTTIEQPCTRCEDGRLGFDYLYRRYRKCGACDGTGVVVVEVEVDEEESE